MKPAVSTLAPKRSDQGGRFTRSLAFLTALNVAWAFLLSKFQESNVYEVLGPYALVVLTFIITQRPARARRMLRPTWRSVGFGLLSGAVMIATVYPSYALASLWFPSLEAQVRVLYRGAEQGLSYKAVAWLLVIIFAEEALWRGRCFHVLAEKMPRSWAAATSLLIYAVAQLGTGSWIVAVLALVCGLVWTGLRLYTGTLVAPLISHLVFTLVVIVAYPVV